MSPEAYKNEKCGYPADVWLLGTLLYEICALCKPFSGDGQKAIETSVLKSQPKRIPTRYSRGLWNLCNEMLVKDPTMRITISDVLSDALIIANAEKYLPPDVFRTEFL